jgi:hypothetical protein
MHADPLPIPDPPGGMLHPHDSRQAVLPRDHRAMGHQAPHLRHQALDRDEQGRPTGVRVGGDQDVARLEIGLRYVQDDVSATLIQNSPHVQFRGVVPQQSSHRGLRSGSETRL